MLPSAWGGRIPPLTMPGRHRRFDDYVLAQSWTKVDGLPVLIDVGCGFPPVTTADTARCFPGWRIYGVDQSFARYVVYDPEGNYACYGRDGEFLYFQAQMDKKGRALYANPTATRQRFESIFADLRPLLLSSDDSRSETVENDRGKLIRNHIRDFETENLTFEETGIDGARIPSARVVRCMNVLIYYTAGNRKKLLASLGELLCDGGILIAGTNGNNLQSRYAVYRKRIGEPTRVEFSFSLDNLRALGVMPWFTIHENDPEASLLAELTGRIRSQADLWPVLSLVVFACHQTASRLSLHPSLGGVSFSQTEKTL